MTITLNLLRNGTIPVDSDFNDNFLALKTAVEAVQALAAGLVPAPVGAMMDYGGVTAPPGWLLCDGAEYSRTAYPALFAVIGTAYGAGDGAATFNVPDRRGRTSVGAGQGAGLTMATLGARRGNESHSHSMQGHVHNLYHSHHLATREAAVFSGVANGVAIASGNDFVTQGYGSWTGQLLQTYTDTAWGNSGAASAEYTAYNTANPPDLVSNVIIRA